MAKRSGRPSAAQTPAPKSDKIVGSNTNKKGSATSKGASSIKLSDKTISALKTKLDNFKKKYPKKDNVSLSDLKAVYRRGSGAFSGSHRPNMSRAGWAYARANKFLEKAAGKKVKAAYVQDDDLLKYEEGGLIAPNGKPSNLTSEQYKLVRTLAFKKWFGDWENDPENASKILNENGEPLVCFHGSNQTFDIFNEKYIGSANDRGFYGRGFYFTFQKQTKYFKAAFDEAGYYGDKIIGCFIKSINPFNIEILSKYKGYDINYIGIESIVFLSNLAQMFPQLADKITIEKNVWNPKKEEYDYTDVPISILPTLIKKYAKLLKTYITENQWGKRNIKSGYVKNEIQEYIDSNGKKQSYESMDSLGRWEFRIDKGVQSPSDEEIEIGLIRDAIEKYDGITVRYNPEGYMTRYPEITDAIRQKHDSILQNESGDELVVFESNQIKLADGTNTTFNENNLDIKFDGGGKLKATGDCYYAAGQLAMLNENIDYVGTPYLVHAEVKGQGKIKGISYGHAWIEDDENVYDFSNGKRNIIPKDFYYLLGGVKTNNPKKYRKYTFSEATQKMLDTGNYGCWDLDVEYLDGGNIGEKITCSNCGWKWNTEDSKGKDKYTCHKCGYDNAEYYQSASKGVLIGDLDSLTNKLLAQKIKIFIDNVKPILYYYINEDSNILVIGLDDNYIEGAKDRLNKAAKSDMEFFDVDSLKIYNKSNEKQIEYSIKLKKEAKFSNNEIQNNNYMKNGGELNPDNKETKEYYSHKSGNVGGMLVGNRHSEGGIKATNKSNGQPIEMEGGEVVITRNAVSDNTKREFNGQMLTNKQILSKINQSGGGVSFEDGGELPENIMVSGKEYSYGGKVMKDHEIVSSCGCKHSMAEGGEVNDRQAYYATLSNKSYEHGGELDTDDLNDTEKNVLNHLKRSIHGLIKIDREHCKDLDNIQKKGIVYITQSDSHSCKDVKLTDYGIEVVRQMGDLQFKKGGEVDCMECGCKEYKKGGTTDENTKYYKGTKHEYNNQFEINKAIEELITDIEAKDLTPEEKQFVSYYAGYGGLEKFGAKGKGLLYEYFTPSEIAKKMWGLAYKHGFKGGLVLEPSCGIGEFIKYAPVQNMVTGYEINEFSAKICKILYPMATIQSKYFETLFIKNNSSIRDKTEGMNKYSLIIGNPPYGSMGGIYAGLGEKSYTKANNYIDYFIFRGLDLLQTDGLLIYIIGTEVAAGGVPFLQQGMNAFKENITKKADIVDAYRLPNGLFETTDVLTDIIVFKKR